MNVLLDFQVTQLAEFFVIVKITDTFVLKIHFKCSKTGVIMFLK